MTAVFRPIAATKIKAGSSRTTCLRDIESLPRYEQREELYRNLRNRQADTDLRPVTKRYTTPYPAFRQVFASSASEGVATSRRVGVLAVLVNGTAVLGKYLIQLRFCKGFTVRCFEDGRNYRTPRRSRGSSFQTIARRNSHVFCRQSCVFSSEKPVEIALKSIPILLVKRSKTSTSENVGTRAMRQKHSVLRRSSPVPS